MGRHKKAERQAMQEQRQEEKKNKSSMLGRLAKFGLVAMAIRYANKPEFKQRAQSMFESARNQWDNMRKDKTQPTST